MTKNKKLELTWAGKDAQRSLEPHNLLEQKDKSYGDRDTENMLIHSDNLVALKSLEADFSGRINYDDDYVGKKVNQYIFQKV
jgi:adenine-specific DNA-methyltransferase